MKRLWAALAVLVLAMAFSSAALAAGNELKTVNIGLLSKMEKIHGALLFASKRAAGGGTYGGVYYDDGKIVLLTTAAPGQRMLEMAVYENDPSIVILQCDYSYAAIENAWEIVVSHVSEIPKFVSVGIATKENRVVLAVEDPALLEQAKPDWFPGPIVKVVASAPLLPTDGDTSEGFAVATGRVNVRKGAGTGYAKLGTLRKGQTVQVRAIRKKWAEIEWKDGQTAYIAVKYLKMKR